jgi:hypothetical protein
MQRLEVSGAVRPLKWSLGVKWLMELFTATGKLTRCGKNSNIVSMCAVSPVVHASNISSRHKKNQFACGCEQFH